MRESLEQEIRTLRSLFWSDRDPDGRVFAPLADAYRRAGDFREALDLLAEGRARHPDFATGHVVATRLYLGQDMQSEAELATRLALELDAENVVALSALAQVLEGAGNGEEAARIRSTIQLLDPEADEAQVARQEASTARPGTRTPPVDTQGVADIDPEGFADLDAGGFADIDAGGFAAIDAVAPAVPGPALGSSELRSAETMELGFDGGGDPESVVADGEESVEPTLDLAWSQPDFEAGAGPALDFGPSGLDEAPTTDMPSLEAEPESEPPLAETVMDLALLAPDPERDVEEVAPTLSGLAPERPESGEEPIMDLAALAPDEATTEEPVMDDEHEIGEDLMELSALAPEAPDEEPVMDLAALAPDEEPVMDLAALAPDEEPVMDLAALAPDEEPVMDLTALAPDEEPVMDLTALAPDEEPVMELASLAPDEEPVMELASLAPDTPEAGEDLVELAALAPDEPAEEPVMDLSALAPDERSRFEEPVAELSALAPDEDAEGDVDDPASLAAAPDTSRTEPSEPVWTRTLAELYVKQGFVDKALEVLRRLQQRNPGAADIRDRIEELERVESGRGATEVEADPAAFGGGVDEEEAVEALARDLAASGEEPHEVDTPFAWTASEPEDAEPQDGGPDIGSYFDRLLAWEPRDRS